VDNILDLLTKYSPTAVLLLLLGGGFIFITKQVTENAISAQFEQYQREIDLRLKGGPISRNACFLIVTRWSETFILELGRR
jgi:hypothetical protein